MPWQRTNEAYQLLAAKIRAAQKKIRREDRGGKIKDVKTQNETGKRKHAAEGLTAPGRLVVAAVRAGGQVLARWPAASVRA